MVAEIKKKWIVMWLVLMAFVVIFQGRPAAQQEDLWPQAWAPWNWEFPKDHGSHPEFRTEWWYFTGNLRDQEGSRYGYQLTFFRQALRKELPQKGNVWSIRDVYLAHFALTDVSGGRFFFSDRISRSGPGLAGSKVARMDVWLLDWAARMEEGVISLKAQDHDKAISLELVPRKPPVLHGENGLSRKGSALGQASYYHSFTNLETRGHILLKEKGKELVVEGISWFDQEFGSNQLAGNQEGWDWFALHLSDGRDLMIYLLRLKDGSIQPASSGTIVEKDGNWNHLPWTHFQVTVLERWKSKKSGANYPSRWVIKIPGQGIDLEIKSLLPDQEINSEGSTGVVYWEGAVEGKGVSAGKPIECEGYVEMTGYAGSLGGLF